MAKRGRKSAAELALTDIPVVDVSRRMPPPPPSELSDAQACMARRGVVHAGRLAEARGTRDLIEYCRHVCRSRLLEVQIAHFQQEWIAANGGLERLDRLLAMAERESKAAIACARALRLTPQAQMHPRVAGRRLAEVSPYPSPWSGA